MGIDVFPGDTRDAGRAEAGTEFVGLPGCREARVAAIEGCRSGTRAEMGPVRRLPFFFRARKMFEMSDSVFLNNPDAMRDKLTS